MRRTNTSKSRDGKSKEGKEKIYKAVQRLQERVSHPPSGYSGSWIKEQATEVKVLLQTLLHKGDNIGNKYELLDQLSQIRTRLTELNKLRKKDAILKTPKSNHSRKSSKSPFQTSQHNRSKSSSKAPSQKRKDTNTNTPRFKKKQFKNKLGSFAKDFSGKKKSVAKSASSRSRSVSMASSKKRVKQQSKRQPYTPSPDSSSISLSTDLKDVVNMRTKPNNIRSKYQAFMDCEKQDAGQLSKEENLLLTTKMESITKERLLREYRILFYRSKEIRKLLSEYYEQNLQLNEQLDELRREADGQKEISKHMKRDLKEQTRELNQLRSDYSTKIEMMSRTVQQQEMNSVPVQDFEHLKMDNEKLIIEVTMLREDNRLLQQKVEDVSQRRKYDYNDQVQVDNSGKLQKELDQCRDQIERLREENIRVKLTLDKEQLTNRELTQQITLRKSEQDGTLEQRQFELNSLKSQLQTGNGKIAKLENTISQLKYQIVAEQEQQFSNKEKTVRLEEEVRIASLRVENREKELNEYRQKELNLKKRILELESKLENQKENAIPMDMSACGYKSDYGTTQQLNKELYSERALLQRTQEQLIGVQNQCDQLSRQCKSMETELQYEQNQNGQLKQRLQQQMVENDSNYQRLQKQLEDAENNRFKEVVSCEQSQKNQENMLFSAQQRISEMETELRLCNKSEQDMKNQLNEVRMHLERSQSKLEQYEDRIQEQNSQIRQLQSENNEMSECSKQQRAEIQQLQRELDSIDRIKDNYKNKYLHNKYESKKVINEFAEKENVMKQTYQSELERVRSEKERLEKLKMSEECQRNQKDKKLRVINDLQSMIKDHKRSIEQK